MRGAAATALAGLLAAGTARADTALEVYKNIGVRPADVMNGSVLQARVLPGSAKQVVALVTYLTGKKDEAQAVDVRLVIYRRGDGDTLESIYSRDYGSENGGYVGRGEVEVVDLDGDGAAELVVTWDNVKDKLVEERRGEVLTSDAGSFRVAWSGAMLYDSTRAARDVPAERRDRFERKLDVPKTLKTRGITLFFQKSVVAVAGERLPEPKVVTETFPFRPVPGGS